MDFGIKEFILTILFIGLIAWGFYLVFKLAYYKIQKKLYTREYFAVIGVNNILTAALIVFSYIFANQTWIKVFNFLSEFIIKNLGFEYKSSYIISIESPSISDKIVALLVLFLVYLLIINIFRSWDGSVSQRQAEEEIKRITPNIFSDFLAYIKKDEKLQQYDVEKAEIEFALTPLQVAKLPWHIHAAELLSIKSRQYKIDIDNDWYNEFNCYISLYGKDNQIIGILCTLDKPNIAEKEKFVEFVLNKCEGKKIHTFLILVKNGKFDSFTEDFKNITIEFKSEQYLLNNLVDLTDYKNYIKKQFEKDEIISGYPVTLNNIYTNPSGTIINRGSITKDTQQQDIKNVEHYVSEWINNRKDAKQLAILGEYGQGKSVLAQRICYQIFQNEIKTDRIPILIVLRGKFPKQFSEKLSLFSDWASSFGVDPRALMKLHYAGKLLLIFDGFDEMELIGDYNIRLDHFRKLWEFGTDNSKFIITGRPNFFINDKELKTLLRTSKEFKTTLAYCEEIHIQPFNTDQINTALRHTSNEIRKDIVKSIKVQGEKSNFYDLMARPTHLFMASVVWQERLAKHKANINSALVYKEFLEYCYSRQDKKQVKTPLATYERAYFMLGIAVKMAQSSIFTNQISYTALKNIVIELYEKFPNEITQNQAVIATNAIPLIERFDKRYDKETVLLDIRSCGVLVRDLSTFDSFKFAHKSFLEYLASEYRLSHILNSKSDLDCDGNEINDTETIIKNSIKNTLKIEVENIKKTPEIFKFSVQLLCNKINFKELNEEQKAKELFKLVYPYKFINLRLALVLRPFMSISKKAKIMFFVHLVSSFTFVSIYFGKSYSADNIAQPENIFTYILFFLILISPFISFIIPTKNGRTFDVYDKFIDGYLHDKEIYSIIDNRRYGMRNLISDNDNLLLWFSSCLELNISEKTLENMLTKKRLAKFKNALEYHEERIILE